MEGNKANKMNHKVAVSFVITYIPLLINRLPGYIVETEKGHNNPDMKIQIMNKEMKQAEETSKDGRLIIIEQPHGMKIARTKSDETNETMWMQHPIDRSISSACSADDHG
jgi:hypothetical protein